MITYLTREEIDDQKWNNCIKLSDIPVVYAMTWYLDIVAIHWDALIFDDYKAVMALPWKQKWGIKYVYQPFFTQQLGIFSKQPVSKKLWNEFLKSIPSRFKKVALTLNVQNSTSIKGFRSIERTNHILPTNVNYEVISGKYAKRCRRNLKTACSSDLNICEENDIQATVLFLKKYLETKVPELNKGALEILKKIIPESIQRECGKMLSLYNNNSEKVATLFYVFNEKRCTMLACASSPDGLKNQAMYYIIDYIIRLFAGSGISIDFFGSSMPNIAYFNESFGSTAKKYYLLNSDFFFARIL